MLLCSIATLFMQFHIAYKINSKFSISNGITFEQNEIFIYPKKKKTKQKNTILNLGIVYLLTCYTNKTYIHTHTHNTAIQQCL